MDGIDYTKLISLPCDAIRKRDALMKNYNPNVQKYIKSQSNAFFPLTLRATILNKETKRSDKTAILAHSIPSYDLLPSVSLG